MKSTILESIPEKADYLNVAEAVTGGKTEYRRITGTQTSSAAYTYATGSTASASTGARTTVSTAPSGSGTAHNNMPPYYALCYIMKL